MLRLWLCCPPNSAMMANQTRKKGDIFSKRYIALFQMVQTNFHLQKKESEKKKETTKIIAPCMHALIISLICPEKQNRIINNTGCLNSLKPILIICTPKKRREKKILRKEPCLASRGKRGWDSAADKLPPMCYFFFFSSHHNAKNVHSTQNK